MNGSLAKNKQVFAKIIMHGAAFGGRAAMLGFVAFLFSGPFDLIKIQWPHRGWLFWDIVLSLLFFVQHSGMIRHQVRARMARFIPAYYHGAIFTLASSFALIVMVLFWQASGVDLVEPSRLVQWLARGVFLLAAVGVGWGVWALKTFDPFGLGPLKAQISGKSGRTPSFTIKGPYLWVRHPLYFFVLVMIWSRADLTADRLLFNLLFSGWIYLGTLLEEKDLVSEIGEPFKKYQQQVPMLIPWKGFKTNRSSAPYSDDPL